MVSLDALDAASLPTASEVEVTGALPADVDLAQVVVKLFRAGGLVRASGPLAVDDILGADVGGRGTDRAVGGVRCSAIGRVRLAPDMSRVLGVGALGGDRPG